MLFQKQVLGEDGVWRDTEWVYRASDYRDFREKLERACKNLNGAAEANESNCAL